MVLFVVSFSYSPHNLLQLVRIHRALSPPLIILGEIHIHLLMTLDAYTLLQAVVKLFPFPLISLTNTIPLHLRM